MQKQDVINKLSIDEKISLMADGANLSPQKSTQAEIPCVNSSKWEEVNEKNGTIYPPFNAIANSWNSKLISQVAHDIAFRAKKLSSNLVITPEIRVKSNPYARGVSEDPYYVRSCAYTVLKSLSDFGVTPCLGGCALEEIDLKYLDKEFDGRTLREYFFSSYEVLSSVSGCAVMTDFVRLSGSYADVNIKNLNSLLHGVSGYVLTDKVDINLTVQSVAAGNTLSFGGNSEILKQAVNNYDYIKNSISRGEAVQDDLIAACNDCSALSPAAVDKAVDKILDFAEACNSRQSADDGVNSAEVCLAAAEESAVLLKNVNGALPLKRGAKIAVIGEPACIARVEGRRSFVDFTAGISSYKLVGSAYGYKLSGDRSDELIAGACSVARGADAVLLFLGFDREREEKIASSQKVRLPANQLALIEEITKVNGRVIAVISGNYPVDTGFDSKLSAVLLAPLEGAKCNEALWNILSGKTSPSGKLTSTCYEDTDDYFERLQSDKLSGRIKAGGFIGYRRYDTERSVIKYPFGFGLSYTKFEYSNISINGDQIEFGIKNVGTVGASEVVQLYVGKSDSAVLRPFKELKGFTKVYLAAGERKILRFKLGAGFLAVYDEKTGGNVVEDGDYEVYIASSVSNVRLKGKMHVNGKKLVPDGKNRSDYIKVNSNVLSEGYTLSPVKNVSSKGKAQVKAGSLLMVLAFLCCAALLSLHITGVIVIDESLPLIIAISALGLLFAVALITTVIGAVKMKNAKKTAEPQTQLKSSGSVQPERSYETLFEEQFRTVEEEKQEQQTVEESIPDDEIQTLKYYDGTINLQTACDQLTLFAKERGLIIDTLSVRKIIAAFCTSRLIFIKSSTPSLVPRIIDVISGYFGSNSYIDEYNGFADFESLMYKDGVNTNVANCFKDAQNAKHTVHIAAVTGINGGVVSNFLTPLVKYVKSPEIPCAVTDGNGRKYSVTPNLWLMLGITSLNAEDAYLIEHSAVIDVQAAETAEASVKSQVKFLSFYQLVKLGKTAESSYVLDEEKCCKKIDKFEKLINGITPYRIGNKSWQRIESFSSVQLACGGEQAETLDCTVASILLPSVSLKVNTKDGEFIPSLENVFGEENITECKKFLKDKVTVL